MKTRRHLLLAGLVMAAAAQLAAQPFDPRLLAGHALAARGPLPRRPRARRRGRARGSPTISTSARSAAASGRATNAGRTWAPIFDGQPIASIGAIAVAPSNPQRPLRRHRRGRHALGHLLRQRHVQVHRRREDLDARRPRRTRGRSGASLVDPQRPEPRLRRGARPRLRPEPRARRLPLDATAAGPGRRSSSRTTNTGAIDLAFDPHDSKTILAALWQTRRPPWNVYPPSNGPGSGLYRSDRRRRHLEAGRRGGFPSEKLGRIGVAFAPSDARRVYAHRGREGGRPLRLRRRRRDAGRARARTGGSGSAAGTSAASRSIRRTPTSSTPATSRCTARPTAAGPSCRSRARRAATTTTSSGSIRPTRAA